MSKKLITNSFVFSLTALVCGSPIAIAQNAASGAGSTAVRNFQARNSSANFSVERIQRQNLARSVGVVGTPGVNFRNFAQNSSTSLGQKSKPFSRIDQSPSVSPYLALSNPFSTASDYYNIVRPQQDQRRINQQIARQQYIQEKRLNQVAAQGPFSITGSEDLAPTGHGSGFMQFGAYMNTGSYFAPPTRPKDKR